MKLAKISMVLICSDEVDDFNKDDNPDNDVSDPIFTNAGIAKPELWHNLMNSLTQAGRIDLDSISVHINS